MTTSATAQIPGTLFVHTFSNGAIQLQFRPHGIDGTARPSIAAGANAAQADLVKLFGFSPADAQAAIGRLLRQGYAEFEISIDEPALPAFFRHKKLT